jgi:multiple sugar transport system substrate-binding protein
MFYNKDLFDAAGIPYPAPWPPMATPEFVDIACQLTDRGNEIWGAAYGDPMEWLPWELVVIDDGRTAQGYVNSATTAQTYETLARGISDGCAPSLNILDPWQQGADFFASGKLAMVVTDFQNLKKIENAGINYGVTAEPTPSGVDPFFYVWTDGVGVMADSEHPEEAKEFIAFLATDGQRIRFEDSGDMPLNQTVADDVDWASGIAGREEALDIVVHARPPVFIPNRWDTYGPIFDVFGQVVAGDKTAQEALDGVASAIQENLDKAWTVWEGS